MTAILIMVGIFVLLYMFMLRPQRKRMQAQQQLLSDLQVGDDILTASGIYGRIHSFDQDSLFLEISDDNLIKITRASIAEKILYQDPNQQNGSQGNNTGDTKSIEGPADEAIEAEEASDNE